MRVPTLSLAIGSVIFLTAPRADAGSDTRTFAGDRGLVRLRYAPPLQPATDFSGRALMSGGWRLMWDGSDAGRGEGIVRFAEIARPRNGPGQVTEMMQIGRSRDATVVARCGTAGLISGNGKRLPNRFIGGHRWTVYRNSDAGMSQAITATDYRTVIDGTCYAIARVTYTVSAAQSLPGTAPRQAVAAARMDAIVQSIRIARRR